MAKKIHETVYELYTDDSLEGELMVFIIAGWLSFAVRKSTKRVGEFTLNARQRREGRGHTHTEGDRENDEPMIFPRDAHMGTRQNGILN